MSDEILKEFDSKIYYSATKNRNNRKRAEVNTVHKEFIKTPIFKDINKDRLQDRGDKLLKNETLLSKPFRDKESLRINRDKIGDPSINTSSLSTQSPTAARPKTYGLSMPTQNQAMQIPLLLARHHNSTQIDHHTINCHLIYLTHHLQISLWALLQPVTVLQVIPTTNITSSNQG